MRIMLISLTKTLILCSVKPLSESHWLCRIKRKDLSQSGKLRSMGILSLADLINSFRFCTASHAHNESIKVNECLLKGIVGTDMKKLKTMNMKTMTKIQICYKNYLRLLKNSKKKLENKTSENNQ